MSFVFIGKKKCKTDAAKKIQNYSQDNNFISSYIYLLDYNEYGCDVSERNGTNTKIFFLEYY